MTNRELTNIRYKRPFHRHYNYRVLDEHHKKGLELDMSKMKPIFRKVVVSRDYDTSRFLTLETNVCRSASWVESLGAVTMGSMVVSTIINPRCNGLRGDLDALGGDYRRVGNRFLASDSRKLAAS